MDCQKHLFSLDENHHYLNCSYLSPMLKSVKEAGNCGIQQKEHPWEITPEHFFDDSNRLRSLFADLINAGHPNDIAILPAVSYGLATVAKNLNPQKGNTIIIAGEQFPSNVYVWKRYCQKYGCKLEIVDPPSEYDNRGLEWNQRILDTINHDTLLVAIGSVHWTDGTLFDLKSIGKQARDSGAYFVLDGTQSVGALPFDVQEITPDALICAGYKWLMGPYSMALGYFSPRLQQGIPLEEGWITRKDSEDFSALIDFEEGYQPGAQRYDVGERSNFILVPMMIEALTQVLSWQPGNIQHYCRDLTSELVQVLPGIGYMIEDKNWRADHMFGIRLPSHITTDKLKRNLDQRNIHISVRGSAIRISPNVYNDKMDIEALMDVLQNVGQS